MKKFILIPLTVLFLISCKKEPVVVSCNNDALLIQIKTENAPVQELTYKGCYLYESIEEYSYKRYTYNSQDLLVKTEQALLFDPTACYIQPGAMDNRSLTNPRKAKFTQYYTYEYDSSLRLKKESYYYITNGNSELIRYQTYEYNGGNIMRINYFSTQDQLMFYTLYTYDDNGNVSKEDLYTNNNSTSFKLSITRKYEYDTKHNPLLVFAIEGNPGMNTNRNNILKETQTNFYEGGTNENTVLYILEYNDKGYPSKINEKEYIYAGGSTGN
jgi:hypothetical protein